jgi:hypothetical protein
MSPSCEEGNKENKPLTPAASEQVRQIPHPRRNPDPDSDPETGGDIKKDG